MNVGVLGSGTVAQTLAAGLHKHGHKVMMGTRDPSKLEAWSTDQGGISVGSVADAAAFGEIIILSVKGSASEDVLNSASAENLSGKIVIDATNPITDAAPEQGVLHFFTTLDHSLMEQLQTAFPEARIVKAFNSVGASNFIDPIFAEGRPTMFICGNDSDAKQVVSSLLNEVGWESADMGGAIAARAIEPLCMLWCIPGFLNNEWTHAFKLLRK
jgi:8-hydroxy-5-deazaflavin:NADPH oxidoreductase